MSIKVILFDLDGTLLPMEQDIFAKTYLTRLANRLAPRGYDPEKLVKTIWGGTRAMMLNDGSKSNEEVFWEFFLKEYGDEAIADIPYFEEFYQNDFDNVKSSCGYNPQAAITIKAIKSSGYRVALATNPLFPDIATKKRISWAGLAPSEFELYTTYENSRYCKPNTKYYEDIVSVLGVLPNECLMVGNDVSEDMVAETLGMDVFLLTDCLINKESKDISVYKSGSFPELLDQIKLY